MNLKVEFDGLDKWYQRGSATTGAKATKFREGACENCGAMGHTRKDCLENPRKRLAKYGGGIVASDDVQQPDLKLTFDGKRDRWNGIDLETHQERLRGEFDKLEEARRLIKSKALDEEVKNSTDDETAAAAAAAAKSKRERDSDDEDIDEDKYADEMELPGQKLHLESKQRISVRNLRMREDTAKYLLNLDPNSAYYDPKSRSMRENPFKTKDEAAAAEAPYAGDNFVRYSGEANRFARSQLFAWEAADKGVELHQQAEPTKLELLHKEFKNKYEQAAKSIKTSVLEKYGGEEYLDAMPKELIFAQTENYVEYSRYGNVVKTQEKAAVKSKYIEDEMRFGHSSVWGSWYANGKWAYKCCRSFDRNAYCRVPPEAMINSSITTSPTTSAAAKS